MLYAKDTPSTKQSPSRRTRITPLIKITTCNKSLGSVSPVSNTYPDFVLEYKEGRRKQKFAVECKWRANIPRRFTQPLFEPEQIIRYQEYAAEKAQNVYIILGIGGEPSMPEVLYLIPIDAISQIQSKPSLLKQFQREVVDKWFSIDEFKENNP